MTLPNARPPVNGCALYHARRSCCYNTYFASAMHATRYYLLYKNQHLLESFIIYAACGILFFAVLQFDHCNALGT